MTPRVFEPRSRGWNLLYFGSLLALVCIIIEIYFRTIYPSPNWTVLFRESQDPRLIYELTPSAQLEFEGMWARLPSTQIRISEDGFRTRPLATVKNQCVGVVLGDSVAFGWGVSEKERFPNKLSDALGFSVLSLAVPGYNSQQMQRIYERSAPSIHPAFLMITLLENDFDPPVNNLRLFQGGAGVWFNLASVRAWMHYRTYAFLERMDFRRIRSSYGKPAVVDALSKLYAEAQKIGIPFIILLLDTSELFDAIVEDEAARIALAPVLGDPSFRFSNDPHPNAAGHEAIARHIVDNAADILHDGFFRCAARLSKERD